jgi:hypothetical protein
MEPSEQAPPEGAISIRVEWGDGLTAMPIQFCDQVIGSYRGDYVLLSFGQVEQPQFMKGDEAAIEALRGRPILAVRTQFRAAIPAREFGTFLASIVEIARSQGLMPANSGDEPWS